MLHKQKKLKFSTRIGPSPFEVVEKKSMIFTLLEYVAQNISQLKSVKGEFKNLKIQQMRLLRKKEMCLTSLHQSQSIDGDIPLETSFSMIYSRNIYEQ